MTASIFMAKSSFWIVAKKVSVWRIFRTVRGKIVAARGFAKPREPLRRCLVPPDARRKTRRTLAASLAE